MKILMLTPYLPYPLFSGGQIRTYNLLKNLANKHDITLFSFIREEQEKNYIPELQKYCQKVTVFKRRPAWDIRNILTAGFSPFPFVMIATYLSFSVRRAIAKELTQSTYNLIHAEPFYMMPNIPANNIPVLLVEQTIEYLVYKKHADDFSHDLFKQFMYLDVAKLRFWEEYFWRKASSLVAMSEEDKKIMSRAVPGKNIDIVANGVDVSFFTKTRIKRPQAPTVLFVGNFKWLPNKDAAKFLTYEIWPLIKQKIPDAKLWIVGKNPTKEIINLGKEKDVVVDGNIEDIREAFGQASVLLAPIRNGRGTKYKVLEAMAAKLPVVSTPLAVEGIEVTSGQDVLVAKDKKELAENTIKILRNPGMGEKIASSALLVIKDRYNWKIIANNLDNIYKKIGEN
jgi:glycosyltransferase involved in cell wall biosynthesis